MKKISSLLNISCNFFLKGQEFNTKETNKLYSLRISSEKHDSTNLEYQTDFDSILGLDKKSKK